MRDQTIKLKTGRMKTLIISIIAIVLILSIIVVFYKKQTEEAAFIPPAFEVNVQTGIPEVEDRYNFGSVSVPTGFSIGLCGTMYQQEDGSLVIYLTNPETNNVNIRCEIKNENGDILYQSGVLKPNEYVERLTPLEKIKSEATKITIFVYGYEQDTWYSQGTIELENILQPN